MVKVDVGSQSGQAQSAVSTASNRIGALNSAITALTTFIEASGLEGSAYTNAKAYASNVLIPLAQALSLYSESVAQNSSQLVSLYGSYCQGENLDSDLLEQEISRLELALYAARKNYFLLVDDDTHKWDVSGLLNHIEHLEHRLSKVREKLRNLYSFNNASAHTFSDIGSLEVALMTGLNQVGSDFTAFSCSKSFPSYNKSQLGWVRTVEGTVEKRYHNVLRKIENGQALTEEDIKVIERYRQFNPNVKIDSDVQRAMETYGIEKNYKNAENGQKDYSINKFINNYGAPALAGLGVDELTGSLYSEYAGEIIEEGIINRGVNLALQNSEYIYNNRYVIKNSAGKIIGKIPGATHKTIVKESTETIAKHATKARMTNAILGEAVSFGPGVLVGVGINMASGDTAEEAWGKEITTGLVTMAVTPIATAGLTAGLTAVGVLAAGAALPAAAVVGIGIGVGIGVNMANDWLREEFPEVKEFEDNVGEAVVDGWNNLCNFTSNAFSFVNPFD